MIRKLKDDIRENAEYISLYFLFRENGNEYGVSVSLGGICDSFTVYDEAGGFLREILHGTLSEGESIGYDAVCQILKEAIALKEKGQEK